jgi:Cu-Zn family superoxide dismutase
MDPHPHVGDLPNLVVSEKGTGKLTFIAVGATIGAGPNSLFHDGGTALVIHAKADDLTNDPSGNSGDRIACGVIAQ